MIDLDNIIIQNVFKFVLDPNEPQILNIDEYCSNRDIFIARLDKLRINLEKQTNNTDTSSLLTTITGEIGNNSFDHNLGNWRDLAGAIINFRRFI